MHAYIDEPFYAASIYVVVAPQPTIKQNKHSFSNKNLANFLEKTTDTKAKPYFMLFSQVYCENKTVIFLPYFAIACVNLLFACRHICDG